MFEIKIVYTESGNKYTVPFKVFEKHLSKENLDKIKIDIKKEIAKL